MYKHASGPCRETIYNKNGLGEHLCCNGPPAWTTYAQTICVHVVTSLQLKILSISIYYYAKIPIFLARKLTDGWYHYMLPCTKIDTRTYCACILMKA